MDKKLQAIIPETLRDLQDLRDRKALGWDAVMEVMRKNDALEESGDGNVDKEDSKHIGANNVFKIDGSPSDAVVNEVCLSIFDWSHWSRSLAFFRPSCASLTHCLLTCNAGQGVVR